MAGQWLGARQQAPQVLAAPQDRAAGWSQEDVTRLASLGACNIGHRGGPNFLKSWRDGAGDRVDQDSTDGEVFDWFAYLGKHPQRQHDIQRRKDCGFHRRQAGLDGQQHEPAPG